MAPLEFTVAARAAEGEGVPFRFQGLDFTTVADPGVFSVLELAAAASAQDASAESTVETLTALYDFLRALVAPEDWGRFRRACIRSRPQVEDLMAVVSGLVPEVLGRPTSQSSDSPASGSGTGTTSTEPSAAAESIPAGSVPVVS